MPLSTEILFLVLAISALLTFVTILGMRWLWKQDPSRASAVAMRSLIRAFWTLSIVLAIIASVGTWISSDLILLSIPLPFIFPTIAGGVYFKRTFALVGVRLTLATRS